MSRSTSLTTHEHQHPEHSPEFFTEITSTISQPLSWYAQRKARHERIQAMKSSGWMPSWGWSPETKPKDLARAVSEPVVPTFREEKKPESLAENIRTNKDWARIGGLLEGIAEVREAQRGTGHPASPPSAEGTPSSAPESSSMEAAAAQQKARREKTELYSVLDSI